MGDARLSVELVASDAELLHVVKMFEDSKENLEKEIVRLFIEEANPEIESKIGEHFDDLLSASFDLGDFWSNDDFDLIIELINFEYSAEETAFVASIEVSGETSLQVFKQQDNGDEPENVIQYEVSVNGECSLDLSVLTDGGALSLTSSNDLRSLDFSMDR